MLRKPASIIMLSLLVISALALAQYVQPVKSDYIWTEIIFIRADGSIQPPTAPISSVDHVTYTLTDNIAGNVPEGSSAIIIERNNTVLDGGGHTLQGTGSGNGIDLSDRTNVTVKNTQIKGFYYGIVLRYSSNNSICENNITNNEVGIYLYEFSSNNFISENNITNNENAITLCQSSNNTISANNMTENLGFGAVVTSFSDYNSFSGNNIANNLGGIRVVGCSNTSVSENNITNSGYGIIFQKSSYNSIVRNLFVNDGFGLVGYSYGNVVADNWVNGKPLVYLEGVSDVVVGDAGQVVLINCTSIKVENLDLSNTTIGVQLWGTNNTILSGNRMTNDKNGVCCYSSSNNTIVENNITNNYYSGIAFDSSSNNSISENNITNNKEGGEWGNGILLSDYSNYNSISGNNITENNGAGIGLDSSSNNRFYHNNLIDNPQQVYFDTTGYANVWDDCYPSGGNYWSDYNGTDLYSGPYQNLTGSDWIGDTPYIIDGNNRDNYPLMNPYPWTEQVDWWPMFHHDLTHTGYSTSTAPNTNQTTWITYTTAYGVASSPVVAGGIVFVGSWDNNVYAFDETTGTQIWNYTTGDLVDSSPAVADGIVYIGSYDFNVYALNATTGTKIWNYTTGNEVVFTSPAVAGGIVYVGSFWGDGHVYALNATTGTQIWNYTTGGAVVSSPAVTGGVVCVGSSDGHVYELDATMGTQIWNYTTGGAVRSSPAVTGGAVYVGSDDGHVYALDVATGTQIWNYTTGSNMLSSPSVADGIVHIGSDNGYVYALNATTGTQIWNYKTGSWVYSSPAVADGKVYLGSGDNNMYAFDASTGALVWSYTTGGGVFSSPAVSGGRVHVGSLDGNVYAFGLHDVAVTNVACSKAVVFQGFTANINVTVANQGSDTETFSVTTYANATVTGSQNVTLLAGDFATVAFTWNTTGFAYGNYSIWAYASPVPGETDTTNNNFTGGWVVVSIPGDLTGGTPNPWDFVPDGKCDGKDIAIVALCFGSAPGCQPPWIWNPNSDVNNDGKVDGKDIALVALHFGQAYP